MRSIKFASILAAGAALALVAGCSSATPAATTEAPAATTEAPAATTEAPAPEPAANYNLTFIQGVIGDQFYITMECGVRDAAAAAGNVTVDVQGGQKWGDDMQIPVLTAVVAKKPDALLIAPTSTTGLQKPLQEAASSGIAIGLVDTTVDDPSFAFTEISSDNLGGGKAAFEALQKLIPDGGKVMVIDQRPGVSTTDARTKGFEDAVKEDPKFEYVGVEYSQNEPSKAAQIVTATLQKYPDLVGIFATNIFSAQGAATGIRQADAIGKVKVVGFDAGPDQVKALQEDTVQAIIAQQPYDIGKQGVEQALKALAGEATTKKIETGMTIITADMLGTPEGDNALYKSEC
jgi:ribose transport system substrate-binding protein